MKKVTEIKYSFHHMISEGTCYQHDLSLMITSVIWIQWCLPGFFLSILYSLEASPLSAGHNQEEGSYASFLGGRNIHIFVNYVKTTTVISKYLGEMLSSPISFPFSFHRCPTCTTTSCLSPTLLSL